MNIRTGAKFSSMCLLSMLTALLIGQAALAQVAVTNTGEGIGEDLDRQRRNPTVSVSTISQTNNVKILVDAYVADPDFEDDPIQFEFYVNRHFLTSQIRSKDLPGPIGVDIGSSIATPPFNYSVIAKVLHPNRVFTTVINGAVFSSNLSAAFDCTLTTHADDEEASIEYVSNSVASEQVGNEAFAIAFDTESTPEGHSVVLQGSFTTAGDTISGTLSISEDEESSDSVVVNGALEEADGKITSFEVASSDSSVTLTCS